MVRSSRAGAPVPSITRTGVRATSGESTLTKAFTCGERVCAEPVTAVRGAQIKTKADFHIRGSLKNENSGWRIVTDQGTADDAASGRAGNSSPPAKIKG